MEKNKVYEIDSKERGVILEDAERDLEIAEKYLGLGHLVPAASYMAFYDEHEKLMIEQGIDYGRLKPRAQVVWDGLAEKVDEKNKLFLNEA